jgi:CHAT domain-containing protein
MRSVLLTIALMPVVWAISSCGTQVQNMYYKGDHSGIINEMERKGPPTNISGMDLYYLCPSLLSQRNYTDFFACCDELEKRKRTEVNALGQFFTPTFFTAQSYSLRAKAYLETGDYGLSIKYGEECMALFKGSGFGRFSGMDHFGVEALGALGAAYAVSGQRTRALEMHRELADFTIFPLRGDAIAQDIHYQKARLLMALKEYDQAIELIGTGSRIGLFKGVGSQHGYMDLYLKFMLAKAMFMKGRYREARAIYEELNSVPGMEEQGELFYQIRGDLGKIYLDEKMFEKALSFLRQAIEQVEFQRARISADSAKVGFVGDKQVLYGWMVGALIDMNQATPAFEYAERGKARALVDLLAQQRSFGVRDKDSGSRAIYTELAALETKYSYTPEESVGERKDNRNAIQALRARLTSSNPELASLVTVSPAPASSVQSFLANDEALLEYYYQNSRLFGFLVTRDKVESRELNGDGLREAVSAFRQSIAANGAEARLKELAAELYNRLIRPFVGLFDKSNVTVVAHGELHYLPFCALYDGTDYLVEKVALRMLPSAAVTQFLNKEEQTEGKLLVLANPDLGNPTLDLKGAAAEAERIKGVYPDAVVLMRKDASETNLKKAGKLFTGIHIAAHGQFNADAPLQSRLLLAPDGQNDGNLTAGELFETRLTADLVVLSACETGLGRGEAGDEVFGFTRALLYAGSRSLVSTLWPVADDETAMLMEQFYKNRKGMTKGEALRQAQVSLKRLRPEPFYWAAFMLTGDPR